MLPFRVFDNYLLIVTIIGLTTILVTYVTAEIKLVNAVFRHGDRTPDNNGFEIYPKDPYANFSYYPTGLGQLTNKGKRREYALGENLRNRYNKFLGSAYLPKIVVARSSDYDRTKMSLQLVLAGLFPPVKIQQWSGNIDWQPIPTSYVSRVDDSLFLSDECPEFIREYEQVLNSPEGQRKMSDLRELMTNLTKLTGKNIDTFMDLFYLYHSLMAESSYGFVLPEWAYYYFPYGPLFDGIVAAYTFNNYNTKLKRLFAGPLIRAMTDNMINVQNSIGVSTTKIYLYSGHETNIAALLHAFDVYVPHVPEYSSAIILELHEINSEYYVKLLYYLGIPPNFRELTIPGCQELCPFDTFLDLITDLIPSNDELICDKRQTADYARTPYPIAIQRLKYNLMETSVSSQNGRVNRRN